MKLTVLVDNNTYIDQYYLGEPGVSYYLEDEGTRILFDTGYSDAYVRNAQALGIALQAVDVVALSHGHNDHTGGLLHFPAANRPRLVAHPQAFEPKWAEGLDISSPCPLARAQELFAVTLSTAPVQISPHITFLGEIPRVTGFEARRPVGEAYRSGQWQPDFTPDDTALAYKAPEGLYIITGCSHAGICNIIAHAKNVCGEQRLCGIIGGMHLFGKSLQLEKTIACFRQQTQPLALYPCHCTDFAARAELARKLPVHEVGVGLKVEW